MFYVKNVPMWERIVRVAAAVVLVGCALYFFKGTPLGTVLLIGGAMSALTGFFGFCPMCAVAGRRLKGR